MRGQWRRTKCAAVAVTGAVALTGTLGTGSSAAAPSRMAAPAQAETFNNGTGQAIAEAIRVDPVSGGLSFGVGIAQALAGHQNTVGVADSRAVNLGVIGVTLAGEGCDGGDPTLPRDRQPQAVTARTGEEGAEAGNEADETFAAGLIHKFARATADPFAEAITTAAPLDIPGILTVSGARSVAHSGVVNGDTREAIAIAEIAEISFAGGQIRIGGYRSEAIHRTGAVEEVTGSFQFGSASIAGVPIPVQDPFAALGQLNAVLLPLGFQIQAPTVSEATTSSGTISVVTPLSIGIVPSTLRDGITGPLLGQLQPVRESVFDALLAQDCGNATYITVIDIVLNALSAGGSLSLEFGGVQATTGAISRFDFGTRPPGAQGPSTGVTPASGGNRPTTGGGAARPTTSVRPGTTPAVTPPAAAPGPAATPVVEAVDAAQEVDGERGGLMAAVAGGGLLLLLGTAEGDRRKMRRAQRTLPMEA